MALNQVMLGSSFNGGTLQIVSKKSASSVAAFIKENFRRVLIISEALLKISQIRQDEVLSPAVGVKPVALPANLRFCPLLPFPAIHDERKRQRGIKLASSEINDDGFFLRLSFFGHQHCIMVPCRGLDTGVSERQTLDKDMFLQGVDSPLAGETTIVVCSFRVSHIVDGADVIDYFISTGIKDICGQGVQAANQ